MAMNYNKLWKLMIDRNLMKKDIIQMAGISTNAMAKMGKGGDVSTQVLRKICVALECKIEDIVEISDVNKSSLQYIWPWYIVKEKLGQEGAKDVVQDMQY